MNHTVVSCFAKRTYMYLKFRYFKIFLVLRMMGFIDFFFFHICVQDKGPIEWERIAVNYVSERVSMARIYKEL